MLPILEETNAFRAGEEVFGGTQLLEDRPADVVWEAGQAPEGQIACFETN